MLTPDSIVPDPANPQSYNRYSYVNNNPVNYTDPSGHDPAPLCQVAPWTCESSPTWWTNSERRVFVQDYGVFDTGHVLRGYRSGLFLTEQLDSALANGGGTLPEPPASDSKLFDSYAVNYQVSGDISPDQLMGVLLGIYMDFEIGYETLQGSRLDFYSSFAPEDLPSDYIGFWAAVNGYPQDALPFLLEELGNVSPWENGSLLVGLDGLTPFAAMPTSIPRNHEFTPMAPVVTITPLIVVLGDSVDHIRIEWQNVPWPEKFQMTPIGSSEDTWLKME